MFPEYLHELKQYGPIYAQWAGLEEDLADPLKGMAGCVEKCGKESEEHVQHLSEVLVPVLHEYVLCAETLRVSQGHIANMNKTSDVYMLSIHIYVRKNVHHGPVVCESQGRWVNSQFP